MFSIEFTDQMSWYNSFRIFMHVHLKWYNNDPNKIVSMTYDCIILKINNPDSKIKNINQFSVCFPFDFVKRLNKT